MQISSFSQNIKKSGHLAYVAATLEVSGWHRHARAPVASSLCISAPPASSFVGLTCLAHRHLDLRALI